MPRNTRYMSNPAFYDLFALDSPTLIKKQNFFLTATRDYDHVLEVGAGTGNIALFLADHGKRVTCAEPSPNVLIALTQKVFQTKKYDDFVSVLPFYAHQIPSHLIFDCIIIPNVIHLIPADGVRKTFLSNIVRILKPNGKLIISFFGEGKHYKQDKLQDAERKIGDIVYRRFTSCSPSRTLAKKFVTVSWHFESLLHGKEFEKHRDDFLCRCDSVASAKALLADFKIDGIWTDYEGTKWNGTEEPVEFVIEGYKR